MPQPGSAATSRPSTRDPMIGIDVGGSRARIALVDAGQVIASRGLDTGRERAASDVCDALAAAARALLEETGARVTGVGVGVAGQVDPATGVVQFAPNLDWHDFPLADCLRKSLGLTITVLNDVQAAAYGEARYGAARGENDAIALFVGTGVGGGIIIGGELVRGCAGSAGEIGHMPIELEGAPCRCRRRGCLEAYIGGWAIARRVRAATEARPRQAARLLELAHGKSEALTAEVVAHAASDRDPLALEIVRDTAFALAAGIAAIANIFNPCVLVLGGSIIEGTPSLAKLAEEFARERILPVALRSLRVRRAQLDSLAGTIGAAAWARRCIERSSREG